MHGKEQGRGREGKGEFRMQAAGMDFPHKSRTVCTAPADQGGSSGSESRKSGNKVLTATFQDLDSALSDINTSVKQLQFCGGESRIFSSPDEVTSMPEEVNFSSNHPYDPHRPNFSPLLPTAFRPYPSFEGWYVRMFDPEVRLSVGVIMATNYATNESQLTLLYCPCTTWDGKKPDVDQDQAQGCSHHSGAVKTVAVACITKEARFSQHHSAQSEGGDSSHIAGFEWEAPGLGKITARPHETLIDVTVADYHFKAHLTDEILWNQNQSEAGPEGWVRKIPLFPTHWYVYSLGSKAEYQFSNPGRGISEGGSGYAHQEKNWGETFPAGHVWLEAMSLENDAQLVLSGAYFLGPGSFELPYVFAGGIRFPQLNMDLRTNDPGTIFQDFKVSPLDSYFEVTAVTASHSVLVRAHAAPSSFSDPILAPMGKLDWKPACRESYSATAEVKVYEHTVWGVFGDKELVEERSFSYAALEFGEDLLEKAWQEREQAGAE